MRKLHAHLLLTLALTILTLGAIAQGEKPQNIYRVTVNSKYIIENGKRTSTYFAIGQLISDSLGRMHTEINYSWDKHYPNNYRWHYFDGPTKVKTDFFLSEKLAYYMVFTYNNQRLTNRMLYIVGATDTTLSVNEQFTYNANGLPSKVIGLNALGKKGYQASFKYDANGTEIQRKVKGKKAIPTDSIMFLKRIPTYDSIGRISAEIITVDKVGKPRVVTQRSYKYDSKGKLTQDILLNEQGKVIHKKTYTYRPDDRKQTMSLTDSNDNLIDYQAWRYEIYKTPNRTQRVLE